ncbi:MAG: hypothetical protein V7L29_29095 [Nostoc sp.]|uniref:hypothetical protein n=1 Tax=Nostoc sp. TaxID=1180 RepID=UPI002FF90B25
MKKIQNLQDGPDLFEELSDGEAYLIGGGNPAAALVIITIATILARLGAPATGGVKKPH